MRQSALMAAMGRVRIGYALVFECWSRPCRIADKSGGYRERTTIVMRNSAAKSGFDSRSGVGAEPADSICSAALRLGPEIWTIAARLGPEALGSRDGAVPASIRTPAG